MPGDLSLSLTVIDLLDYIGGIVDGAVSRKIFGIP